MKNAAKTAADAVSHEKDEKQGTGTGAPPEENSQAEGNIPGKPVMPRPRRTKTARGMDIHLARLYSFESIDSLIDAATVLSGFYKGKNSLYRIGSTGEYRLAVHQSDHTPEDFNRICNVLTEYGRGGNWSAPAEAHLKEQETCVLAGDALQKLAALRPAAKEL